MSLNLFEVQKLSLRSLSVPNSIYKFNLKSILTPKIYFVLIALKKHTLSSILNIKKKTLYLVFVLIARSSKDH